MSTDLGLAKNPYKGLKFYDLTHDIPVIVNSTFALNSNEKAVLRGNLSFDRHENSWRYNDEIVISLWSKEPPIIESRAENSTKYRLEIPIPLMTFNRMCSVAQTRINNFLNKNAKPVVIFELADFLQNCEVTS